MRVNKGELPKTVKRLRLASTKYCSLYTGTNTDRLVCRPKPLSEYGKVGLASAVMLPCRHSTLRLTRVIALFLGPPILAQHFRIRAARFRRVKAQYGQVARQPIARFITNT